MQMSGVVSGVQVMPTPREHRVVRMPELHPGLGAAVHEPAALEQAVADRAKTVALPGDGVVDLVPAVPPCSRTKARISSAIVLSSRSSLSSTLEPSPSAQASCSFCLWCSGDQRAFWTYRRVWPLPLRLDVEERVDGALPGARDLAAAVLVVGEQERHAPARGVRGPRRAGRVVAHLLQRPGLVHPRAGDRPDEDDVQLELGDLRRRAPPARPGRRARPCSTAPRAAGADPRAGSPFQAASLRRSFARNSGRGPSFSTIATRTGRATRIPSQSSPAARCSPRSIISVVLPAPPSP